MAGSPLAALVESKDAAYALSALYLGMELLANLDGSLDAADSLFASWRGASPCAAGAC